MIASFSKKVGVAALAAAAATTFVVLAVAQPAQAYEFPFKGECGAASYFDGSSQTEAKYSHTDGNKLWYRIYWGGQQPVPDDPAHRFNWAFCTR